MGASASNEKYGKAKKTTRGTTRNKDRLSAFAKGSGDGGADWRTADNGRIQAVVVAVTALGGAVTFGLSRDMGAYSVTLMLDDNRKTLWFNGDADLTEELTSIAVTLANMES